MADRTSDRVRNRFEFQFKQELRTRSGLSKSTKLAEISANTGVSETDEKAHEGNLVKVIEIEEMTHYHCDGTYYEYHETCPHIEAVEKVEELAAI